MGAWIETCDRQRTDKGRSESRPAWARGLKPELTSSISQLGGVAPRVGAWIETLDTFANFSGVTVAPRVGAWIETFPESEGQDILGSRPAWARGLKPGQSNNGRTADPSRPAWARGLKLDQFVFRTHGAESRPAWARGLKPEKPIKDALINRRAPRGRVD